MVVDKLLSGVRYKGDVSHGELVLPVTGNDLRKKFLSPLVLFAGKAGAYDGDKSFNESKISLKVTQVTDPIVRFLEFDVQQKREGTATALSAAGSTTLEVDDATFIREREILHFPLQNLNVLVTAIAGNTLTIERPIGVKDKDPRNITPTGVEDSADIDIPAAAEFRNLGRAVTNKSRALEERKYNAVEERSAATQIMRSDQCYSRRRLTQEVNDRSKQTTKDQRKAQELFYIMEDMENCALFGKMHRDSLGRVNTAGDNKSTGATTDEEFTTSDGIFNVIETYAPANVLAADDAELGNGDATLDMDLISKYMKKMDSEVGSVDHIHLCSADVFNALGKIGQEIPGISYDIPFAELQKDGVTGRHVKTISTQFGPMTFMYHPLLKGAKYNNLILSVRTERIQLIGMKGAMLQWKDGAEDNDLDGEAGYYISDMGVLVAYAPEHFILDNITIPA